LWAPLESKYNVAAPKQTLQAATLHAVLAFGPVAATPALSITAAPFASTDQSVGQAAGVTVVSAGSL
jgi:hypothetical protein